VLIIASQNLASIVIAVARKPETLPEPQDLEAIVHAGN
jgi:hypothetical protein